MLIHYRCLVGAHKVDSETPVIFSPKNWMIGSALLIPVKAGINTLLLASKSPAPVGVSAALIFLAFVLLAAFWRYGSMN